MGCGDWTPLSTLLAEVIWFLRLPWRLKVRTFWNRREPTVCVGRWTNNCLLPHSWNGLVIYTSGMHTFLLPSLVSLLFVIIDFVILQLKFVLKWKSIVFPIQLLLILVILTRVHILIVYLFYLGDLKFLNSDQAIELQANDKFAFVHIFHAHNRSRYLHI